MNWIVSHSLLPVPGLNTEPPWVLKVCKSEDEAKAYARKCLEKGKRVRASLVGSIDETIGPNEAYRWAGDTDAKPDH
jgi:hypothetical protein